MASVPLENAQNVEGQLSGSQQASQLAAAVALQDDRHASHACRPGDELRQLRLRARLHGAVAGEHRDLAAAAQPVHEL